MTENLDASILLSLGKNRDVSGGGGGEVQREAVVPRSIIRKGRSEKKQITFYGSKKRRRTNCVI